MLRKILPVASATLLILSLSSGQDEVIDTIEVPNTQAVASKDKTSTVVFSDESPIASEQRNAETSGISFPAPKSGESPITNVAEIIDTFLTGKDWQEQLPLIFNSDSVKEEVKTYYTERSNFPDYHAKLFQMELDPKFGGPFWVFNISRTKESKGFPIVVRQENENLKIDWHTFTEFTGKDFVRFIDGKKKGPAEFRLIVEPLESYSGPDREGFLDLSRYDCYKLFPPYGEYEEFTEYAFVEKHTAVASQLSKRFVADELPLAMVVELDIKSFKHGIRHSLITDIVAEGWLVDPAENE